MYFNVMLSNTIIGLHNNNIMNFHSDFIMLILSMCRIFSKGIYFTQSQPVHLQKSVLTRWLTD